MRVSARTNDPGYAKFVELRSEGKLVHVFLDENPVKFCVTADDEAGTIIAPVLDGDGNVQIDPKDPDAIWEEERFGAVKIVVRDQEP